MSALAAQSKRNFQQGLAASSRECEGCFSGQHLLCTLFQFCVFLCPAKQYCLPVLKTEDDRLALLEAVRSGNPKFFMGTDSAPHPRNKKEQACCHAGCFTMHAPVELYATAFAEAGCLDKLEASRWWWFLFVEKNLL